VYVILYLLTYLIWYGRVGCRDYMMVSLNLGQGKTSSFILQIFFSITAWRTLGENIF